MLNWILELQSYFQSLNNVSVLSWEWIQFVCVLYELIGPLFQSRVPDLTWFLALLQNVLKISRSLQNHKLKAHERSLL